LVFNSGCMRITVFHLNINFVYAPLFSLEIIFGIQANLASRDFFFYLSRTINPKHGKKWHKLFKGRVWNITFHFSSFPTWLMGDY
jgi:hypothetical protein